MASPEVATEVTIEQPSSLSNSSSEADESTEKQAPIQDVVESENDAVPSPITTLGLSNAEQHILVSIRRVEFEQSADGVHIGAPFTTGYTAVSNGNEDTYNSGYDFDGEIGPFNDAIADEVQYSSEEEEEDLVAALP
jgi:hypothetical protein